MKYLNYIVYLPGLAGKFTRCLTSLHPSTFPHLPNHATTTNVSAERADLCSYADLYARHGSWENHHSTIGSLLLDTAYQVFLKSDYTHYNYCWHPHEFYQPKKGPTFQLTRNLGSMLQNKIPQPGCHVRYLQMAISAEYQSVIDEFKVKNGNFPVLRAGEIVKNSQFTLDYNPYIINVDNYFIGESNFLEEYTKLMDYLEIPAQVELALPLYQGWIKSRNSTP